MRSAHQTIMETDPVTWHITFAVTLCAFALMAASSARGASVPSGAVFGGTSRICQFSIQLQDPALRVRYAARIASAVGSFWASKTVASAETQVQSDAPVDLASLLFGKPSETGIQSDPAVDPLSRDCLTCHDGMTAVEVDFNYRDAPGDRRSHSFNGAKDHPNGMDYARYVAFGRGDFKPVGPFNAQMVFVDGKVGCLTCHNPMNPEPGHLVMNDRESALCRTCHDK